MENTFLKTVRSNCILGRITNLQVCVVLKQFIFIIWKINTHLNQNVILVYCVILPSDLAHLLEHFQLGCIDIDIFFKFISARWPS